MSDESVTGWFHALQHGNEQAASRIWARYFHRIAAVIRRQITGDAGFDEEDVALSVFDALFRGAKEGRFQELADRDELWGLLLVIARRKLIDRNRIRFAGKRMPKSENASAQNDYVDMNMIPADIEDPGWSLLVEDECRRLLRILDNERWQSVALLKLDGLNTSEIAERLQLSESTVKRTAALVRKRWEQELKT